MSNTENETLDMRDQGESAPSARALRPSDEKLQPPTGRDTQPKKPKLSGAQRRKLARTKAHEKLRAAGGASKPLSAELLPMVKAGDLESVRDYRHGMNGIYARMLSGEIASEVGTRLVYVLQQAAGLARIEAELLEASLIRSQLMELSNGRRDSPPLLRRTDLASTDARFQGDDAGEVAE